MPGRPRRSALIARLLERSTDARVYASDPARPDERDTVARVKMLVAGMAGDETTSELVQALADEGLAAAGYAKGFEMGQDAKNKA